MFALNDLRLALRAVRCEITKVLPRLSLASETLFWDSSQFRRVHADLSLRHN